LRLYLSWADIAAPVAKIPRIAALAMLISTRWRNIDGLLLLVD
jgi:hypothetical protein